MMTSGDVVRASEGPYVTEKEAQRLLCIGRTKLWAMAKEGRIEKRKLDGKNIYRRADLMGYMASLPRV